MINKGVIVSIQGYSTQTTQEMAIEAISAGAVAIKTDKKIETKMPLIGLQRLKVRDQNTEAHITPASDIIAFVNSWAGFVAVDYRRQNWRLQSISDFCKKADIAVIAEIGSIADLDNIIENDFHFTYISTALSVIEARKTNFPFAPDIDLLKRIKKNYPNLIQEKRLIAEGNFQSREDVREAFKLGINNVCIGNAIANIYKLTKKYITVLEEV